MFLLLLSILIMPFETSPHLFAALILGVLISATLNSSTSAAVVKYLALIMFMPFILVSVQTNDDLRRVVRTLVLAMTIAVPYAFWQLTRWNGRLGVGVYESNYFAANPCGWPPAACSSWPS